MFLNITKAKDGQYQFRNGQRRMALDEVVRRCPVGWVREIDGGAADFLSEYARKNNISLITCENCAHCAGRCEGWFGSGINCTAFDKSVPLKEIGNAKYCDQFTTDGNEEE